MRESTTGLAPAQPGEPSEQGEPSESDRLSEPDGLSEHDGPSEHDGLSEHDRLSDSDGLSEAEQPEAEPQESELDPEREARRAAALAHVRQFGDPVLRTRARAVERIDDALREQIRRMGELMIDAMGVGLAATQIGVLNRVLVYRIHQGSPFAALINPEIEWAGDGQEIMEEGCLSLPAVHVDVERPVHIRVRGLNELGEPLTIEASGLEARVIQHEVDHLNGVLVLDRIPRPQRKEAMRALREAQQAA